MSTPDNTAKSDTGLEGKTEAPTASANAKPAVATRQEEFSTLEKLRNAVLTGCGIGFFYALFHNLNISLKPIFWWLVLAAALVFIFARSIVVLVKTLRRRAK
jgi:hypothetical protein